MKFHFNTMMKSCCTQSYQEVKRNDYSLFAKYKQQLVIIGPENIIQQELERMGPIASTFIGQMQIFSTSIGKLQVQAWDIKQSSLLIGEDVNCAAFIINSSDHLSLVKQMMSKCQQTPCAIIYENNQVILTETISSKQKVFDITKIDEALTWLVDEVENEQEQQQIESQPQKANSGDDNWQRKLGEMI